MVLLNATQTIAIANVSAKNNGAGLSVDGDISDTNDETIVGDAFFFW